MRPCVVLTVMLSASTLALPQPEERVKQHRSCRCGVPNRHSRIVGGDETGVHEYPWQAALMRRSGRWSGCGGTVISDRHVLTAAHCTHSTPAEDLAVLLRAHRVNTTNAGEVRIDVNEILIYPGYTSSQTGYDFSLLRLAKRIAFPSDNSLAPACLPTGGASFVGSDAVVSGWGRLGWRDALARSLRAVTVTVISNAECGRAYNSVSASMVCAEGGGERDACQGDSGGPLVSLQHGRYALMGVVSWGHECAAPGFPGVYARVTAALDWIRDNTADDDFCE